MFRRARGDRCRQHPRFRLTLLFARCPTKVIIFLERSEATYETYGAAGGGMSPTRDV
jgi:hypothetical protein